MTFILLQRHDSNKNGILDGNEIQAVFYELNEKNTKDWLPKMFEEYDTDKDGSLSLDEFVKACYGIFLVEYMSEKEKTQNPPLSEDGYSEVEDADGDEDEEEAGVHEKTTDLPADEQQRIIKKEAFSMLALGTFLVVTFSDPMVDVIGEIANRIGVNAFYVSFILVPLASNGSELLASVYYAKKKTSKTMKVALTSLEGAACMNNTFCLAIFMALIAFRGLAWVSTFRKIFFTHSWLDTALVILTSFSKLSFLFIFFSSYSAIYCRDNCYHYRGVSHCFLRKERNVNLLGWVANFVIVSSKYCSCCLIRSCWVRLNNMLFKNAYYTRKNCLIVLNN